MPSRWFHLKEQAIGLRRRGISIRKVEQRLGVPRSTLSFWFKNVELSVRHQEKLLRDRNDALARARKEAVHWHNLQKEKRLQEAERVAMQILERIDTDDLAILELAVAMLYLGEGTKRMPDTAMGSSDPSILKFFVAVLRGLFHVEVKRIKCQLSLRADQDPEAMKHFWAETLRLPLDNFNYVSLDKRTRGSKTYSHYKGVCLVRCGNVAIQRRLVNLSKLLCEHVTKRYLGP